MNFPVNRWTIAAAVGFILVFGDDFVAPILKVMAVLSAGHYPAV